MKKQIIKAAQVISVIGVLLTFLGSVTYAGDIATDISLQTTSLTGSNNSLNIFSTGSVTEFSNKDSNSDIVGDYFKGYYYNNLFGFFTLNHSSDDSQNVRIIGSTSKCGNSYGYKLGGYAKSVTAGLIDFDYSQNVFVYYCMNDKKLHGKAYSKTIGYQDFEGISLEVIHNFTPNSVTGSYEKFLNNSSIIFTTNYSGYGFTSGEKNSLKYGSESIFYIWKPKK